MEDAARGPAGSTRWQPFVLCAVCGARFQIHGGNPGDSVPCAMCRAVVVLGELHVERRRYRPTAPPVTFAPARADRPRRRRWSGADARGALPYLIAGGVIALALSPFGSRVLQFLYDTARERIHRGR